MVKMRINLGSCGLFLVKFKQIMYQQGNVINLEFLVLKVEKFKLRGAENLVHYLDKLVFIFLVKVFDEILYDIYV